MIKLTLAELASITGGKLYGNANAIVTSVAPIDKATKGCITFLSNLKYKKYLVNCNATAIIFDKKIGYEQFQGSVLLVDDSYVAFAKVAQVFDITPKPSENISTFAVVHENVLFGKSVSIGAHSIIESGVKLGDNTIIGPGCFIGRNVILGKNTTVWANVTIYHEVIIGNQCLIQSGAVIGSDGFGYANEKGEWIKIPQVGTVRIGNRVEIGACTTIDRGALEDTIIEDNVILDNQLQIAHNVQIGYGTAIAGGTIIAGSTRIGKYCTIGGGSVINGHIEITNGVTITGMSMVVRGISKKGVYSSGIPLQLNKDWRKTATRVHRIDEMNKRLKALERLFKESKTES
ncbi:UDP-3-O-(3-hydroxymyristoyl)glucosamine N-acyltransferase [Candidatus Photodesmus anomalopis]|uniref:UDP-3-O-acylglucosamine N-acyltransferase n=1 Tax=Candidatus Photodesmus katoptron Akat1 TaxID=1236703 RepID=S3DJN2_9GAMM|nr:UDP-3-O-(3-hydroxymyristoyl)glucosamine N-acyltransferase [Candidatus Photodesmus katoptron]EPE37920.1 UDP-3-O-[3-hydroxymyristoyl] glucosamine N-acyltransferase [Candidatus Photodesmus katoptron Akat1]